ncbi:MAG: hypothetical protein KGM15_01280 [Pseudomonadota bacterium]|nr:hypothetical protein [Pseudomonadota bacterium]
MTRFATFWHGPLNPLIRACLASFPARGADLTLFSYAAGLDPPEGVARRDARDVCPDAGLMQRYRVGGRVSLATFSDRFRYEMMAREDLCWVDADMLALRPCGRDEALIWGRQAEAKGKALINNAVLRLPNGGAVLAEMLAHARAAEGREIGWGAIGPYLLTEIAETHGVYASAAGPERFYPVAPDEFWRLFDPRERDAVARAAAGSEMAHLWSELLRRTGYDFDAAPPSGSYLSDQFAAIGALGGFARTCEPAEIAALVARWNASAPEAP